MINFMCFLNKYVCLFLKVENIENMLMYFFSFLGR
jgi:hypothetical protein